MFNALRNAFSRDGKSTAAAGTVDAEVRTDPAKLEAWITQWIATKANLDPAELHRDKQFSDFGLDSLMAVNLSGALEELLGRSLSPSIAWEYSTIGELAAYLAAGGSGTEFDMDSAPTPEAHYGAEERDTPAARAARA